MDKDLSYVLKNISGIWYNNDYFFDFFSLEGKESDIIAFTNRKEFPKFGKFGKFWIRKEFDSYILQIIIFYGENPINQMVFKIEEIDGTIGRMCLSGNEMLSLAKVV